MDDSQWAEASGYFKKMDVPAKTMLLRQGEIARRIFLIATGCIRVWFNSDGDDLTLQFFFENETIASIESFKKEIPSMISIETIEPCSLWYIQKSDLDKLLPILEKIPEIRNEFIDNIFERMFLYMKHFFSFIKDTPLQRYEALVKEKPEIIQRVPQHYIASYLGISSVHLSRIKKQFSRTKQ
jgi:CRP-like cAMP-binding protein